MAGQIRKQKRSNGTFIENTWLVRIFLGRESDGKRKYFSKTVHGTRKDAQRFLTAKLREKDLGTLFEPTTESLSGYLDRWLAEVAKPRLRETTYEGYERIVNIYIKKHLGKRNLSQLQGIKSKNFITICKDRAYRPGPFAFLTAFYLRP